MSQVSRLSRLPSPISHFLGHRSDSAKPLAQWKVWIWSFVGAFGGIAVLQALFGHAQYFIQKGVPSVIASCDASAVLIYGAIESPLAQPRSLIGGHFIGALVGVCITKLFHLLPTEERFQDLQWLAGSLSCAITIVAMQITGTTHPPAGATALLAVTNADVREMGWYYLPVVLLSAVVLLVVALLTNNIQRRYPIFWVQPALPPSIKPDPVSQPSEAKDKSTSQVEVTVTPV